MTCSCCTELQPVQVMSPISSQFGFSVWKMLEEKLSGTFRSA